MSTLVLVVRKKIRATPQRLFEAWTQPNQLMKWWGPRSVTCTAADIDLKVGGHYRIANQFSDGTLLWICGQFEIIEPPTRLVYTWRIGPETAASERVSVSFVARGVDTEVIVTHERILAPEARDQHEKGWVDCLAGLADYLQPSPL